MPTTASSAISRRKTGVARTMTWAGVMACAWKLSSDADHRRQLFGGGRSGTAAVLAALAVLEDDERHAVGAQFVQQLGVRLDLGQHLGRQVRRHLDARA